MSERARALEQALLAIRHVLQGVSPCAAINAAAEAWSIANQALLAVDPPPSGASPQAETSALARLREFVTQAQVGTKQRGKGQFAIGEIVGIQGTLNVLLAEIDKLAAQPCRVCGGYGFIAQKQTIDDGWGEVDTCPSCSDQPAPVSPQAETSASEVAYEHMLAQRGLDRETDTICVKCYGSGVRAYGNTATWRGGIGGSTITMDVCDRCWGSGNDTKRWPSHRLSPAPVSPVEPTPEPPQDGGNPK